MPAEGHFRILGCVFLLARLSIGQHLKDSPACDRPVYCDGPLLEAMQAAHFFNDSKTFVDLNMKADADVVLSAFANTTSSNDNITRKALREFMEQYFEGPGNEYEDWEPSDWTSRPAFLGKIKHEPYRRWAADLHALWKDPELGRKVKEDVRLHPERYSLLYSPNAFIVPGGRFRELYYWDSYWVIRGLLLSEMKETTKGMLENFLAWVKEFGFVPNAGRVYQSGRSQPPFLSPSFAAYLEATSDIDFLNQSIGTLEDEYNFWMTNRSILVDYEGKNYTMNRYDVKLGKPRPESFREDTATAAGLTEDDAAEVYADIASAAEAGWGFSTRWFARNNTSLTTIRTREIIPVDLNALLCWNERLLGKFHRTLGDSKRAEMFEKKALERQTTLMKLLWDPDAGIWFDWDLAANGRIPVYYVSSFLPLFTGCYGNEKGTDKEEIERKVLDYIKRTDLLDFKAPIPTSLIESGEQWDFPNLWPPTQHMLIEALDSSSLSEAREVAHFLAARFLATALVPWEKSQHMYEKFDVRTDTPGRGGEYKVQIGFGWTNGVAMILLDKYGYDVGVTSEAMFLYSNNLLIFVICVVIKLLL
ncbi:trehalase-like [Lineus longissimus]|uniref:trehalase-like n=1 Tax=Lineus longissimus TaxID=88925 RepID=UPI00315DC3CA